MTVGRDDYMFACLREQVEADGALGAGLARGNELSMLRRACIDAALGRPSTCPAVPAYPAFPSLCTPVFAADAAVEVPVALTKSLAPSMPECLGYDLADPEVCAGDAERWFDQLRGRAADPVLIVGVRTGGSYFAPIWAAVAGTRTGRADYVTLRPIETLDGEIGFAPAELGPVREMAREAADVVIVDDQPDTGRTVLGVAAAIGDRPRVWVASPGRIYTVEGRRLSRCHKAQPIAPRAEPALWHLLLDRDHPVLIARVLDALGAGGEGADDLTVVWGGRALERRYGRPPWLPWDHPALERERRQLINPQKSPFALVDRATGLARFHARFVGEGLFGRAERDALASFGEFLPAERAWVDGYLIARDEPGLALLADALADASPGRTDALLSGAVDYWQALARHRRTLAPDAALSREDPLRARVLAEIRALAELLGDPLAAATRWAEERVAPAVAAGGATGALVRSSLPYSFGAWHWRARPGRAGIRRFHIDANWGGLVSLDLEVASFLLEHRLAAGPAAALVARTGERLSAPDLARGVRDRLPEALLLRVRACLRIVRQPSRSVIELVVRDLEAARAYVDAISPRLR